MRWIELDTPRRDRIAPEFSLQTAGGDAATRAQFRQKRIMALVFVPDPAAPDAQRALDAVAAKRDSLDLAAAVVYAIGERADAPAPVPLLADPGGAVRAAYAALFPPGDQPGADAPFVVVLDRFGAPQYGAHGPLDAAVGAELDEHVWIVAYDCPECVVPEWPVWTAL